jgi:hypothetical protein
MSIKPTLSDAQSKRLTPGRTKQGKGQKVGDDQERKVPRHDGSIQTRPSDGALVLGQSPHNDGQEKPEQCRDGRRQDTRDDREGPDGRIHYSATGQWQAAQGRRTTLPIVRHPSTCPKTVRTPQAVPRRSDKR